MTIDRTDQFQGRNADEACLPRFCPTKRLTELIWVSPPSVGKRTLASEDARQWYTTVELRFVKKIGVQLGQLIKIPSVSGLLISCQRFASLAPLATNRRWDVTVAEPVVRHDPPPKLLPAPRSRSRETSGAIDLSSCTFMLFEILQRTEISRFRLRIH